MTATVAPPTELLGTLQHVPPGQLLLQRNIRQPKLDPEFLESVKELGVLQPITAVLNDAGDLVVRFGERRTLAALAAELPTVPVYVVGADDQADAAEVDRIIRQRDENTRRDGLTAADEIGIVEQLAAFGLPAEQIVKRARISRDTVNAAVATTASKLARKAVDKYEGLTLDQAAAIADFDDDPETAKALIVLAIESPGRFTHEVQRTRDERDRKAAEQRVLATLAEKGVPVVERPYYADRNTPAALSKLNNADGKKLTQANHADCPGHVAWLDYVGGEQLIEAVFACSSPRTHGHKARPDTYVPQLQAGAAKAEDLSPDEREKAKKKRRLVIDNNKAWASAQTVRREWLATFAKRKAAPKGTAAFIARAIASNAHALSDYQGAALAAELLGLSKSTTTNNDAVAKAAEAASDGRALQIALVRVLAAYEAQLNNLAWRNDGRYSDAGRYLRFLESAGYALSDVEKFATSAKTVA